MKIAVIGAGAIGSVVAGFLMLKGEEVTLTGRPEAVDAITRSGLQISGVKGNCTVRVDVSEGLHEAPELAILCTKTQDIEAAVKANLAYLGNSLILTTQNGIRAEEILAQPHAGASHPATRCRRGQDLDDGTGPWPGDPPARPSWAGNGAGAFRRLSRRAGRLWAGRCSDVGPG